MGSWVKNKGYTLTRTKFYNGDKLPDVSKIDWLVIMGGLMNVYQYQQYPWLKKEKQFIKQAIDKGVVTLGVCLGAQLISCVLGGKVTKNENVEIGWHQVKLNDKAHKSKIYKGLGQKFMGFHWHGDTFSIPKDAIPIGSSRATKNQGFLWKNHVVAIQFHLDYSLESIEKMLKNCSEEMVESPFVQTPAQIRSGYNNINDTEKMLYTFLDNIESANKQ